MPTTTECYSPIKGLVLRVIQLNDCGAPVTGASGGMIVAAGFTQVTSAAQYETGDRQLTRRADGAACVNEKDCDILTNFELTIDLCLIDPGLVVKTVSPSRLLTFSSPPTGTGFALAEGCGTSHWSLEVWQRVAGNLACGSTRKYVYNAWPHLTDGKIGDYNINIEPSTLTITANSLPVNTSWTAGNPWLGSGAISIVPDHWFQNITTVAPPTAVCGIQDYTAP